MAPTFSGLLAALCARSALSAENDNDVSLLQKSLHFSGEPEGLELLEHSRNHVPIPQLVVDLDVAPEKRWRNVTRYYTELGIFPQAMQLSRDNITAEDRALLKVLKFDEEYLREMRGMVADFEGKLDDPQATLDLIKLVQVGYEVTGWSEGLSGFVAGLPWLKKNWFGDRAKESGCSGLLAAMPDGTVVHGRNMDYSGFEMEVNGKVLHYPDVTIEVTYLRSGKPLLTSSQWPGSIGLHTAMRFGGWSFEQNTRPHGKDVDYIYGMLRKSQGFSLSARKIMETVPDFETAITKLYALNLMAPMYFIVAGTNPWEGAVITIDRGGAHSPDTPPMTRLSSSAPVLQNGQNFTGKWHIIQTNDDQGAVAMDERRPAEEARLLESSQDQVSVDWVRAQLMEPPIYNDATVFTTVFVPSTGYHKTIAHLEHER